jgi:hypothetical protein
MLRAMQMGINFKKLARILGSSTLSIGSEGLEEDFKD